MARADDCAGHGSRSLRFIEPAIDIGDFFHPALALHVLKVQDIVAWPVKVIRDVGYLLVQAVEGVANYPPSSARSTSNSVLHCGQATGMRLVPSSLIRR